MDLKEKIDNLPKCCGVYLMKDSYENIIYVGKSVNLRSRVKSYFREKINRSKKIEQMVKFINDIDYIVTDTELDALLLECDYIHHIRPMYNTLMNKYEKYKYIKLDVDSVNLIDVLDTSKEYEKIYKILYHTLCGEDYFLKQLEEEMTKESLNLNFERAMEIKDNLELLIKDNSKYFRNALVLSNYADYTNNIVEDNEYLISFFNLAIFNSNNLKEMNKI